jgi:hypothetical protein
MPGLPIMTDGVNAYDVGERNGVIVTFKSGTMWNTSRISYEDAETLRDMLDLILRHSAPCGDVLCANRDCQAWRDADDATWD